MNNGKATLDDLRDSVISCLSERKLRALALDEAHNLKKIPGGQSLLDQMDIIKSFASDAKIKHLLFGTYELLDMIDLSGQLNRRMVEIEFPRYRFDLDHEREAFYRVLVNLLRHMPVKMMPSFSTELEYIYIKTLGCIGIMKDWLSQSLLLALENGDDTISISHLNETEIPDKKLNQIFEELDTGEKFFNEAIEVDKNAILGMPSGARKEPSPPKSTRQNTRPGTRKPVRDVVGSF